MEITNQIPLRTSFETQPSDATPESRAKQWLQIREGLRNPEVILNMYEQFDVTKVRNKHFSLFEKIETDH